MWELKSIVLMMKQKKSKLKFWLVIKPIPFCSKSKQIHRNNNVRLYKTLVKPVLCYASVT